MGKQVDKNDFWFIENNPITKVGVYPYLGKQISQDCEPDKIYYVLRPKEELFRKETLDSLRLIPLIDGHTMIGKDFTAPEDKGLDGTLGDNVSHDTDTIYNDLKIISNKMKDEIQNGKKELSLGYFCRYDKQPGTYKGQRYDYVQRDIIANHLALVDKGRMGADVRVYDSKNIPEGEAFAMDSIDIAMDKDEDIEWITVRGTHVPIKKGESKEQAVKNFLELKRNGNGKVLEGKELEDFAHSKGAITEREREEKQFKDIPERPGDKEFMEKANKYMKEKKLGKYSQQQSGSKAELKKGDKIRFADTQGVEYKFVGENRGMLEFENIDDDTDRKGFLKKQLEERLKDGSMQISGSNTEPGKSEWDKERDKENERHEKLMIKLKKEIEDATDPQEKKDLIEHRRGMIKEHNRRLDRIFKDEEEAEQAGKKTEKEEKLTEATTTTKNTSKEEMKTFVTNKAFFDNRIDNPTEFKKEMNYAFNDLYGEMTEYERKKEAKFDDIYEAAVKRYLKAKGVPERLANHKNFGTINRISKFAEQNKMLKGKNKEGFNEFLTEVFINYADEEDKGTPNINALTERAIKQYKEYNTELKKSGQKKFGEDSMEYKTIQGEDAMADKKMKVAIDEDKRKIIDEIGGILKDEGLDDELIRTVIGKAEKLAYNKSEAGDEGEEVEEEVVNEETEEEDKPKKTAKDKCGKDEEKDDEEAKKKELVKEFAKKEKLAKEVEDALGTFDHSEMTELEIAKYACDKLDLEVEKGQEISAVKGYLKGLAKAPKATFGYKTVAADSSIEDAEFEKFTKGE